MLIWTPQDVCVILQSILLHSGGISMVLILHQCFGMYHTRRVGGSVFWLSHFRMKFLIWHLSPAKRRDLGEKQKKKEGIWPLWGDACFHGDAGACACVYDDLMNAYLLLASLFFCQVRDVCLPPRGTWCTHMSQIHRTTSHWQREKSQEEVSKDIDHSGNQ